jgi:uncharacterized damage-inducible protein DinB
MKQIDILRELLKHMEWADSITWKTVLNCSNSNNDEKIKDILLHYHTAQQKYFSVWKEESFDIEAKFNFENLTMILNWVIEYYTELNEFFENLNERKLEENVIYPGIERIKEILGKTPAKVNFIETVLQVVIHTSHHRGQVNKRLREIGGKPEIIDFIAWAWLGKPKAVWNETSS